MADASRKHKDKVWDIDNPFGNPPGWQEIQASILQDIRDNLAELVVMLKPKPVEKPKLTVVKTTARKKRG